MRIAVLDFHSLASDSRVLRAALALHQAGHKVLLIGYGPSPKDVPYDVMLLPPPPSAFAIRAGIVLRQVPANVLPASAHILYWLHKGRRKALKILEAFRPDAVHANDWNSLPLALEGKARWGARIVYDSHEMAVAEYEHSLKWRLIALSHVIAIERRGIRAADAVIAVSPGIVKALQETYPGLPVPTLIRNVPDAIPAAFRPTGEPIEVLFHGLLRDNRGLESIIRSLPRWRDEFRLVLRGPHAPNYRARLEALARESGVVHRVRFEAPVAASDVVARAAASDIGLCILPDTSRHNRFALPNKLFEYLMAGLAVVTSPVPDMGEILRRYECGITTSVAPDAIANAINGLDRTAIDGMKQRAIVAAGDLSWAQERKRLVALYDKLLRAG
jgi:glycosyltransferase involved in cell wall biosynthesis